MADPITVVPASNHFLPCLLAIFALLAGLPALADDLTDGRALVDQILARQPTKDYLATGTLKIRDGNGQTTVYPVTFKTIVTSTNWQSIYEVGKEPQTWLLNIVHSQGQHDVYYYTCKNTNSSPSGQISFISNFSLLSSQQLDVPFANSDFWIADLGLEFLQWPRQKLLRKEIKRSRGCSVLESTNPDPSSGGYSRVISWIDSETGGIVQAKAYDAKNQLLKEFYPKDFNKIDGEWQVGMMEMDNDQTDSRSRLEFDRPEK